MAYELLDFNISVATVQFGNTPSNFQKNVTKSKPSTIASYNNLMDTNEVVERKQIKTKI
jgi:short-subunit dehydrogenase